METDFSFRGKKFLITQPMIRSLCGSTMVTLELAEYLSSIGAKVIVYTNIALPPALSFFQDSKIKVISSKDKFKYSLKDFDYIWVHSLTFPKTILDELVTPPKKMPAFIFLHMAALDIIPDEHPWIYNLEKSLSSLSLYISEETLESNKKYGLPPKTALFRNPAPLEFENLKNRKISRTLKKILIISNHPPVEVLEAKKKLIEQDIRVDTFGEGQDKYVPLSPKILKKYDAAITIGKSVQYCIIGSFPVYIYDWYGGPGWLNKDYEKTKINNFSGRFSEHKTGEKIAKEIIDGYSDALDYHINVLSKKNDEFELPYVLNELFSSLKTRKIEPLDSEYVESVKAAVTCAEIRFMSSEELGVLLKKYNDTVYQLDDYKGQVEQLTECKKEYDALRNSKRVKILNALLSPHDKIKSILKKSKA